MSMGENFGVVITYMLRAMMMRQRAIQQDLGLTPGGIYTHATNAYPLVAVPWIDAMLNGEWAFLEESSTRDWVECFSPEYHMHGSKKILDALYFAPDLRLENQRIT